MVGGLATGWDGFQSKPPTCDAKRRIDRTNQQRNEAAQEVRRVRRRPGALHRGVVLFSGCRRLSGPAKARVLLEYLAADHEVDTVGGFVEQVDERQA
jgi:hypothetical protein